MKLKSYNVKMIESSDWDKLVKDTYSRPYCYQQQDDCKSRGIFEITIPSEETYDEDMNDIIPEKINGDIMGVKFKVWLERDPKQKVKGEKDGRFTDLFWERNFYPDIHTLANDMYEKGLIDAGQYVINIDW